MKAKHKPPTTTAPSRVIVNTAPLTTSHHSIPVSSQPTVLPVPTTVRVIPTAQPSTTVGTRLVNLPQSLLRQTTYVTTQGAIAAPQGNIIRISMRKSSGGVAGTRSIVLPSGLLGNAVVRMQQPGGTLGMQRVRMPVRGQSVFRGVGVSPNVIGGQMGNKVIYTTNVLPGGAANRYVVPGGATVRTSVLSAAGQKLFPSGSIGVVNSCYRSNSPAPLVYGGPNGPSLGNGMINVKLSDKDVSRLWVNEDLKLRKPHAFNVSVFYFWLLRPLIFSVFLAGRIHVFNLMTNYGCSLIMICTFAKVYLFAKCKI